MSPRLGGRAHGEGQCLGGNSNNACNNACENGGENERSHGYGPTGETAGPRS